VPTEADTCRTYVLPALYEAGWTDDQIAEQRTFTDGRIVVTGGIARRGKGKRADYVLSYRRDRPLAGLEYYEVKKQADQLRANAFLSRASGSRLEADDPHPTSDGTNLRDGMVPVPIDDPSDTRHLALPDPGKHPWWMFWR
jgi:hypothetical protein